MQRRHLLAVGRVSIPVLLSGCVQPPGDNDETPSDRVPISITSQTDQPAVPVEYDVEMVESVATSDHPARLRVTLTNPTEGRVVLGEERDVQFHHVTSTENALYLHPAGEETWEGPVEPGCWQLTEFVAVPEYYGTVPLDAGESTQADSYVYGHPELPEDTCLPEGEHRLLTTGIAGGDEDAVHEETDVTEFEWGFTLQIGE